MVSKIEQLNLEDLATKNTAKIVRFLTLKPYLSFGLTELSKHLKISKSHVLRILKVLRAYPHAASCRVSHRKETNMTKTKKRSALRTGDWGMNNATG